MEVVQVEFRRVRNLGNYETAELKLVAIPSEGEDFKEVIAKIKSEVLQGIGLGKPSETEAPVTEAATPVAKAKGKNNTKSKPVADVATPAAETPLAEAVSKPSIPSDLTLADVKTKMKQVVKEVSYDTAMAILGTFGVAKTDELPAEKYILIMAEAEKALKAKEGK
jgi:hypothetical protein